MSKVILFENEELGQVRTIRDKNNEPLFCLNDICKILNIKKTNSVRDSINKEFDKGGVFEWHPFKTPKYKCTGEFYNSLEWKLSAKLQLITQQAYESLSDDQRYMISRTCGDRNCYDYYQKIPFTKECWTY
ncbi:TPA: hypothetical protein R6B48_001715 [Campylobacter coli]|nr:hypothetical protein [Campylobacter coli]HED7949212.1 hypothetical protein [Campylobacter coli]